MKQNGELKQRDGLYQNKPTVSTDLPFTNKCRFFCCQNIFHSRVPLQKIKTALKYLQEMLTLLCRCVNGQGSGGITVLAKNNVQEHFGLLMQVDTLFQL